MRVGPRSHSAGLWHLCHATSRCEHASFYTTAFSKSRFPLSVTDGQIQQLFCIWCCLHETQQTAKRTLGMSRGAFGVHCLSWTAVREWHSRFKACEVPVQDKQAQARQQKMWRTFDSSSTKTPFRSVMEFATRPQQKM
jgi:hypothetical protein